MGSLDSSRELKTGSRIRQVHHVLLVLRGLVNKARSRCGALRWRLRAKADSQPTGNESVQLPCVHPRFLANFGLDPLVWPAETPGEIF